MPDFRLNMSHFWRLVKQVSWTYFFFKKKKKGKHGTNHFICKNFTPKFRDDSKLSFIYLFNMTVSMKYSINLQGNRVQVLLIKCHIVQEWGYWLVILIGMSQDLGEFPPWPNYLSVFWIWSVKSSSRRVCSDLPLSHFTFICAISFSFFFFYVCLPPFICEALCDVSTGAL